MCSLCVAVPTVWNSLLSSIRSSQTRVNSESISKPMCYFASRRGAKYCYKCVCICLYVCPLASQHVLSSCWDGRSFGHNRRGPKSGGCSAPPLFRGSWFPSNTMSPGPRPTSIPSDILIHPTVWPQYTNVTDKQDRQTDNGPITQGEPFYKRSPKNHTSVANFIKVFVHLNCGRVLVLFWLQCNTLWRKLTSFVDDVMFAHNHSGKGNANKAYAQSNSPEGRTGAKSDVYKIVLFRSDFNNP